MNMTMIAKNKMRMKAYMKTFQFIICILFSVLSGHTQTHYLDSLKKELSQAQTPTVRFRLMDKILEHGYISGEDNPDSAYCLELLDIAQKTDNDSLLAIAYNQVGNYFFRSTNDLIDALDYFFKGIPYAEKAGDKRRLSSLYIDIAAVYYKLNNPLEEIKYIRKSFAALPGKSSPLYHFMVAQAQYHIAEYFSTKGQFDSALFYTQALDVTNLNLKSQLFDAAVNGLMGKIYDAKGDKALAAVYIKRADEINDSMQYLYGKIEGKKAYIGYLLKHNETAEARSQATMLLNIGRKKNIYEAQRIAAGFLTTLYDKLKQPDSAFYYSRMESALKDSLFNQDNQDKIQALAFNERIRMMEEADKLADEAAERNLNIQYALLALGILFIVILYLLLSRRVITNTRVIEFFGVVTLLIVFEFLNLLLHPFLERVTHHEPVLMLLALVCIAALLVPLHHKLEKWATATLVEKNKKLRLASAKKTIELLSGH